MAQMKEDGKGIITLSIDSFTSQALASTLEKLAREQVVIDMDTRDRVERILDESLWEAVRTNIHNSLNMNETESAIFVHPVSTMNASFRLGNVHGKQGLPITN